MTNEQFFAKAEEIILELETGLSNFLLGEKIPVDVVNSETGEILIPANRKITPVLICKAAKCYESLDIDPGPIATRIFEIVAGARKKTEEIRAEFEKSLGL